MVVTRSIKHWGLSGYSNNLPRIKFGITGQNSRKEKLSLKKIIATDSLTQT